MSMGQILIFDGAMGTMLQQRGLAPGQSPEELNLTMPDVVESVHRDYLQAGADIVITNTFGQPVEIAGVSSGSAGGGNQPPGSGNCQNCLCEGWTWTGSGLFGADRTFCVASGRYFLR